MAAAFPFRKLVLPGLLVLAGCGSTQQTESDTGSVDGVSPDTPVSEPLGDPVAMVPPVDPADPTTCNAPAAGPFVGRQADEAVRRELAAAVAPVSTIRWVAPGDATTEDYSAQRLNVMLDLDGAIASAHCG